MNYESQMVGEKPISMKRSLQGQKKVTNHKASIPKQPYDASHGMYMKKGGSVKKKMAAGGAAKIRKGMMTPSGKPC